MAVGNPLSANQINAELPSLAVRLRNLMDEVRDWQEQITDLGTSGLEGIGYSAGDAASVQSLLSYMNTFSQIYYGTGTQASTFNFDNALSALWGGQ